MRRLLFLSGYNTPHFYLMRRIAFFMAILVLALGLFPCTDTDAAPAQSEKPITTQLPRKQNKTMKTIVKSLRALLE